MQIMLGLPEPREFSSLPRLRLVQSGIKREHSRHTCNTEEHWTGRATNKDIIMLWAAAVLCFFGFFRAGELMVPSLNAYDPQQRLSWGDIAIDNHQSPKKLELRLKKSKD